MTKTLPIAAKFTVCCALALGTVLAQAHARLTSAEPAPNATVTAPPSIALHFSEAIARKFSSFKVTGTDGKSVPIVTADPTDADSLAGKPTGALPKGHYSVTWTAVSTDDGHKMTGKYSFTVQ